MLSGRTVRERGPSAPDAHARAGAGLAAPLGLAQLGEDRFDTITDRLSGEPCPLLDD